MILIVGETGSLGSATTQRLLTKGMGVRVMTSTPENATELQKLGAEVVQYCITRSCCASGRKAGAGQAISRLRPNRCKVEKRTGSTI